MQKQADSTAVPFAGSASSQASMAPVPVTAVDTKPAPGQTGPRGMAPRTNYSRVNAGASPTADAGASAQKSVAPDAQSFLPHKVAHTEVYMSHVTTSMTLQDMIKSAAAGANDHVALSLEAERQSLAPSAPKTSKTASAQTETIPTAYAEKFASALEYVIDDLAKMAEEPGPGTGPNHLEVSQSMGGKNPFTPGSQGQATSANLPPKNPGTHKPAETPHGPANALEDNASMMHGKQKLSSVTADELRAAVRTKVAAKEEKKMCEGCGKEKDACTCSKTATAANVDPRLVDLFLAKTKVAEDAINPAHISAGPAVAPDTSAAGQPGGAPVGGKPQGATNLISSNDAAINYTKGQAKADPKRDVGKLLREPALSAAHDKTLGMAFKHTGQAGVKISSVRTVAARAALEKMAEEAAKDDKEKKKKESTGGGFTAPPVGGVAGAGM